MPGVDDALQKYVFLQQAEEKILADASQETCEFVSITQINGNHQMDDLSKVEEGSTRKAGKPDNKPSSLEVLGLAEFRDGMIGEPSRYSVDLDSASCRENCNAHDVNEQEKVALESMSNSSAPGILDLQIAELPVSGNSGSEPFPVISRLDNEQKHDRGHSNAAIHSCCNTPNTKIEIECTTKELELENLKDKDKLVEQDSPLAVWVKWRGKWQTGILCTKVDCPLQTLRAKPAHERKTYLSIFFPHTRTYVWADTQLVCLTNEMPEPLVYGSHQSWLELAKDLSAPRRFVMQKLAVSILDIGDKLHTEAVTQSARMASFWKEFAREAFCCKSYSELGLILLKLQRMILPRYVNPDWLNASLSSWEQQCHSVETAESVELLTKELTNSVVWNDVQELWSAPVQPELGSEWKMWKQEAMQLFGSALPPCNGDAEQESSENSAGFDFHRSAKRPKVETLQCNVDDESEHHEVKVNATTKVTSTSDLLSEKSSPTICIPPSVTNKLEDVQPIPQNVTHHCDEIPAEHAQYGNGGCKVRAVSADGCAKIKYKKCLAFMEARGKQCGRWASDGGDYCCVHTGGSSVNAKALKGLSPIAMMPMGRTSHALKEQSKFVMCMGTTTHGNKCKHRARNGSYFCKKHYHHSSEISSFDQLLNLESVYLEGKKGVDDLRDNSSHLSGECSYGVMSIQELKTVPHEDLVHVRVGETLKEGNRLMNRHELYNALHVPVSEDIMHCIGWNSKSYGVNDQCQENATHYTLYCEKHLPKYLKHSKGGRARLISKEVFLDLLKCCSSREDKLHLHQACQIFYHYMRRTLSNEIMASKEDHLNWILSEASKNLHVGEYLLKLVSSEREKLCSFVVPNNGYLPPVQSQSVAMLVSHEGNHSDLTNIMSVKCKACVEEFTDEQALGVHWMNTHRKEAKHLFRGYACAICMNSFTGKKVLESHINDKHGMQFLQHSVLFRCMSCNSHFPNHAKLWEHILSFHSVELRIPNQLNDQLQTQSIKLKVDNGICSDNTITNKRSSHSFSCGLCSMQFDLLTDLESHHQAVHRDPNSTSAFLINIDNRHTNTIRHQHSRLKIGHRPSFRGKHSANLSTKRQFQASSSVIAARLQRQAQTSVTLGLGRLAESECSTIADRLFAEIRQTKPQPSNSEILSLAREACCATYIHNNLVVRYGTPSESLYLRAVRFCSELNIPVSWHIEGFVCPKGCEPLKKLQTLAPLKPLSNDSGEPSTSGLDIADKVDKEMDGCHFIISPRHLSRHDLAVLCEDVSFGKESVPVTCVIDDNMKHLAEANSDDSLDYEKIKDSMPWQSFSYVTQRLLDSSLCLDLRSSQMGCGCKQKCNSGDCDHVYLLNDDYENAEDVVGSSMHGKFPYDEKGQIQLKEGFPVYECNSMCNCDRTCQNRVLQNGMRVKLEIFRTEKKGWAVRAREAISRGTFVCEYIGEIISAVNANGRYSNINCKFLFDIGALASDLGQLTDPQAHYMIDATKYGNISRFINHSCSPNLACYLVLIESMECQFAHVGLFASQDIPEGEELAFDYRATMVHGDECPCYCGSSNCRGLL